MLSGTSAGSGGGNPACVVTVTWRGGPCIGPAGTRKGASVLHTVAEAAPGVIDHPLLLSLVSTFVVLSDNVMEI